MKLAIPVSKRDHVQGLATAPLTLVQYGDYECPYCGQAFPIVKAVQKSFGDKLRVVFRNYPLTQAHQHALHAAKLAEAVALHHDFWTIHDLLYRHQSALGDRALLGYAKELGLSPEVIAADLASEGVAVHIQEDIEGGDRSGVDGTPTFFINGVRHEGSWDQETLTRALELSLR